MKIFHLPDLGEGLTEAELVAWHVNVGDHVVVDQPLVSVETAKAIVEIPSPRSGVLAKLYGEPGDIIETGDPLVEFEEGEHADTGTVVGTVETSEPPRPAAKAVDRASSPRPIRAGGGIRATPAVRALANRLGVDLGIVKPTGRDGMVTAADVQRAARVLEEAGPLEPLRGTRRAMARNMALAHAEIVPVTLCDDADIQAWSSQDVTLRLIQAIVAGCRAEPALNAWYDGHAVGRRLLERIDLAIAVDSPEGLFTPVLRDVGRRSAEELRSDLEQAKKRVRERRVPPEEMRGYTFTLTNFGTIAGRYANPIFLPPTVAILGAGVIRDEVVAVEGAPAVHRMLPLSLTFDHRAVTGGEAGRFLAAVIADLQGAD
ncbi:MAG: dihydrolipoamide acetyltransferase family protein [Gammaproteobacteria bacterium]